MCLDLNKSKCFKKPNEKKFEDDQILKWIKDLINGLYYLHENSIIHRDIKPEYLHF
jgi:serine/threonine protein kinase